MPSRLQITTTGGGADLVIDTAASVQDKLRDLAVKTGTEMKAAGERLGIDKCRGGIERELAVVVRAPTRIPRAAKRLGRSAQTFDRMQ
jgi:hypothetical protein